MLLLVGLRGCVYLAGFPSTPSFHEIKRSMYCNEFSLGGGEKGGVEGRGGRGEIEVRGSISGDTRGGMAILGKVDA